MTNERKTQFRIIENMGWLDRIIRMIVGTAMLIVPIIVLAMNAMRLDEGGSVAGWWYVVMLVALYPFWTCSIGWDPIYSLFNVRTCGGSEKNPCGTFPYEVDAAVGHHPIPDSEVVHSRPTMRAKIAKAGRDLIGRTAPRPVDFIGRLLNQRVGPQCKRRLAMPLMVIKAGR